MVIQNRDPQITTRDPVQQKEPQHLKPIAMDICDECQAVNSFVAYSTRARQTYYRCKKCGRTASRPKTC